MPEPTRPQGRLGRGLASLISSAPQAATPQVAPPPTRSGPSLASLPIRQVKPNPYQPRKTWDEASLRHLAESIKASGIIQPIIVKAVGDHWELIAGERRLRAATAAGLTEIPAVIRPADPLSQAAMSLAENTHRLDLNPLERAEAYARMQKELGLTQVQLAERLGEDRPTIANHLRLLDLAEPVRAMLRNGQLTLGHAKLLASIADILEQQRLAELVVSHELSVRNLERAIQNRDVEPKKSRGPATSQAHIADMETRITRALGMRTRIVHSPKGRGRLVISYADLDQFQDLLDRLGVPAAEHS